MNEILSEEAKKFFQKKGKKGGNSTVKKHGLEHFKKIAIEAWKRRKGVVDKSP